LLKAFRKSLKKQENNSISKRDPGNQGSALKMML
jgi:hypothetical protein